MVSNGGEWRDGFRFAGGHPALDLTATVRGRLKDSQSDLLATPEDLARWLSASGLSAGRPETDTADLTLARELREAVYIVALAKGTGGSLPPSSLETLNRIARGPSAAAVLGVDGSARWDGDARSLLGHLARAAVVLLSEQTAGAIRQCGGDGCAVLFHDQSRASGRRWCSMSVCGNRAKAAGFRRRDRAIPGG